MAGSPEETVVVHDLVSLLSSQRRDFLIRNNGDQVKVNSLSGKVVALYFSASWCSPCLRFTPHLVEIYEEISGNNDGFEFDFEVVFISCVGDEESFNGYLGKLPWLAVPFSEHETRKNLLDLFKVREIPCLVILDQAGRVSTEQGVSAVYDYGVNGYPFNPEKLHVLREEAEKAKKKQSITSLLVHGNRDFVISNDQRKVSVSELEGKTVGIYFSITFLGHCVAFTEKLIDLYKKVKEEKGEDNFEVVLVSLDTEEQEFRDSFGTMPWLALPFKDKKCDKLVNYFKIKTFPTMVIIGSDGNTVHTNVSETIERHGEKAYPFTQENFAKLAEIEMAKLESQTLESILVSSSAADDNNQVTLVSILEEQHDEMAKGWPEKLLKHELHPEHELTLVRRTGYGCDGCLEMGHGWSYLCKICDFDLHPNCALNLKKNAQEEQPTETKEEGYICDGDVCRKAST